MCVPIAWYILFLSACETGKLKHLQWRLPDTQPLCTDWKCSCSVVSECTLAVFIVMNEYVSNLFLCLRVFAVCACVTEVTEADQAFGPPRCRVGDGGKVHSSVWITVQRWGQRAGLPCQSNQMGYLTFYSSWTALSILLGYWMVSCTPQPSVTDSISTILVSFGRLWIPTRVQQEFYCFV